MVAPASANIIGKVANGIADDMLSTTIMACKSPKLIAPAMNTNMFENPIVQDNLTKLKSFGYEIINPETGEVLPAGEQGELVITCIKKEGLPLIRYRTKDITRLFYEKCKCGRTFCRMENLSGRSDDMLKIRGVNVFPSQIEEVILSVEELGPHYEIILEREGYLDKLTVKVELAQSTDSFSKLEKITAEVRNKLKIILGLDAKVMLESPNTLQRFEGKAKRVKDLRNKV